MAGFQAFADYIVRDKKIRSVTVNNEIMGYEFEIKYPSYRGTYLSCIEALDVWVDGKAVDKADLRFRLNGKEFLFPELKELFHEYWFVQDYAVIRVISDRLPDRAVRHSVKVYIKHRIPYTGYFGSYLSLESANEKSLELE